MTMLLGADALMTADTQAKRMTKSEWGKLHTIIAKLEILQNETRDKQAAERMLAAKNELLRIKP